MARLLKEFRVRIITWNVASTYPKEDLRELLGVKSPVDTEALPELFAIGYQEISVRPLNVVGQLLFEEPWVSAVRSLLAQHGYVKLISYQLQGLMLVVFVQRTLLLLMRNISATCVRTGVGGFWGNKGACVVSLQLGTNGTSLCFVNSHLAAHEGECQRRILEYKKILASVWFDASDQRKRQNRGIYQHSFAVWFGDLNFRLDDVTMDELREAIREGTIMDMLEYDQLLKVRKERKAFELFNEEEITFKPTFKFHQGTANYKLNARKPAWTDRILFYRSNQDLQGSQYENVQTSSKLCDPVAAVNVRAYRSHEDYLQSDHKPVSALFSIDSQLTQKESGLPTVFFYNVSDWSSSTGFELWFYTSIDVELSSTDWIGLLPEGFTALDEYVGYVWVDTRPFLPSTFATLNEHGTSSLNRRMYRQEFSDQLLILPGSYVLVYFRNLCDVLGISEPFKVKEVASKNRTIPSYYRVSS